MEKKLISREIKPSIDISKSVKAYVHVQMQTDTAPFPTPVANSRSAHKVSLTDWRNLIERKAKTPAQKSDKQNYKRQCFSSPIPKRPKSQTPRFVRTHQTNRTNQRQFDSTRADLVKKQSFLGSALVQNFYENQWMEDRKIKTAKVRRHYEKLHEKRPFSINWSRNENYRDREQQQKQTPQKSFHISLKKETPKILNKSVNTEKYEMVKLRQKFLRRRNYLKIEGLIQKKQNEKIPGFRYVI